MLFSLIDTILIVFLLVSDLFVFKVVNSLFGSLGLHEDFDIQQQYFGEWICILSTEIITKTNVSSTWRPMIRYALHLCANLTAFVPASTTLMDTIDTHSFPQVAS